MKVITTSDWHEQEVQEKPVPGFFVTASAAVLIRNQLKSNICTKEEA